TLVGFSKAISRFLETFLGTSWESAAAQPPKTKTNESKNLNILFLHNLLHSSSFFCFHSDKINSWIKRGNSHYDFIFFLVNYYFRLISQNISHFNCPNFE